MQTQSRNGANPPPTESLLAMLNGGSSPLRRGGMNVAETRFATAAAVDAASQVFSNLLSLLQSRESAFNLDIERLQAKELAKTTRDRVAPISEFADLGTASLAQQSSYYRSLTAGHPSAGSRKVDEVAARVVEECVRPLKSQFAKVAAEHPFQCKEIGARCLEALELLSIPDLEQGAVRRLQNVADAEVSLRENLSSVLPHLRERLLPEFVERGKLLAAESLYGVCFTRTGDALRIELEKLRSTIEHTEKTCSQFRRKVNAVKELFEREQRRRRNDDAVSLSSTVFQLDGPSSADLIAGMISREGVSGTTELAEIQLGTLTDALQATAKARFPHVDAETGIGELIARLPAEETIDAVLKVAERSVGGMPTAYKSIGRHGVSRVAKKLHAAAQVLVNLSGYDHEVFHIQPIRQTIVRFPPRLGIDDEQVYLDLKTMFSALDPGCLFADAGEGECDISCARSLIGFPICVEEMNACLLEATATCFPHPPFLFGLLTDDGQPMNEIKRLFELLNDSSGEQE